MKIAISDYDGTLYINQEIQPELIESIKSFREKGNKFCICTGRPIESIYEQLVLHGIPYDFIVGMNGSIGVDQDYKEAFGVYMDKADVYAVKDILENHGYQNYSVSNGYVNMFIEDGNVNDDEFETLEKSGIRGFYILKNNAQEAKDMSDWLNNTYPNSSFKAYPNRDFVSISVKGSHKANGVRALMNHTGWVGDIMTFGDDFNDIPMLKAFDSYGIESGVEEAIAYAKHIVPNVNTVLDSF